MLVVEGERLAMTRRADGWWTADRRCATASSTATSSMTRDRFRTREACTSRRRARLSQCVDHSRFEWTDAQWQPRPLAAGILYELHVGTFSEAGTFDGAIAKLPHLVDLGVTHVELMPVCEFSGERGWGYDGVDLFAPHHAYGGRTI